jgi:hypothetical protein
VPSNDFGWPILSAVCAERVGLFSCFLLIRFVACPTQTIQSTVFNLSLDKQHGISYSLVKVPLTMSPLPPSSHPQPCVYPRPPIPLLALSTIHRTQPTFPHPFFLYPYELPLPRHRFAGPLFPYNYELLFSQALCFDNHLRCPLFFGPAPSSEVSTRWVSPAKTSVTPCPTHCCRLFVVTKKLNPFAINQIRTLSAKHPGWGLPMQLQFNATLGQRNTFGVFVVRAGSK